MLGKIKQIEKPVKKLSLLQLEVAKLGVIAQRIFETLKKTKNSLLKQFYVFDFQSALSFEKYDITAHSVLYFRCL